MSTFKKRLWQNRFDTIRLYYKSPKFALLDLAFGCVGLFFNPYRTCRKFLQKKGKENIYAYGETPYTTYQKIIEECGIGPQDTWIEMGAGRGKGCFWLNHFIGCKVIGIEQVPQFVWVANVFKKLFGMKDVSFIKADIQSVDLSSGTILYLYGLWPNLKVGKGTRIITTGEPLANMRILKSFWVRFPWGRTTAYLQKMD